MVVKLLLLPFVMNVGGQNMKVPPVINASMQNAPAHVRAEASNVEQVVGRKDEP